MAPVVRVILTSYVTETVPKFLPIEEQLCQGRPRCRRQTRRLKPGSVAVELPPGVLENAGGFGGSGKDRGAARPQTLSAWRGDAGFRGSGRAQRAFLMGGALRGPELLARGVYPCRRLCARQ